MTPKRFIVEFEGEEDYNDYKEPRSYSDDILCMIPVGSDMTAIGNARELVAKGIDPNFIMIVKYRFKPNVPVGFGFESHYASAISWDALSEYNYESITRNWWWEIMYYPSHGRDERWETDFKGHHMIGYKRMIHPSTDFEYFEILADHFVP